MKEKKQYTREELIAICERAIVAQEKWEDRDSCDAMQNVGQAWALLKAGCKFKILTEGDLKTNDKTIWIQFTAKNFAWFEMMDQDEDYPDGCELKEYHYLPTSQSLEIDNGKDWY